MDADAAVLDDFNTQSTSILKSRIEQLTAAVEKYSAQARDHAVVMAEMEALLDDKQREVEGTTAAAHEWETKAAVAEERAAAAAHSRDEAAAALARIREEYHDVETTLLNEREASSSAARAHEEAVSQLRSMFRGERAALTAQLAASRGELTTIRDRAARAEADLKASASAAAEAARGAADASERQLLSVREEARATRRAFEGELAALRAECDAKALALVEAEGRADSVEVRAALASASAKALEGDVQRATTRAEEVRLVCDTTGCVVIVRCG